jgi:2-polyprenyl-3-methyl-5-hydroxy-6-metoxy-1,4-benzoquinol methylase
MDYTKVYTNAFNTPSYSNDHHIQYDYVIDYLKTQFTSDSTFNIVDIGSGRGQLISLIKESFNNAKITSVDLEKFHFKEVNNFIKCDLSNSNDRAKLLENKYDILVSTDVLEHLDISFIDDVIQMFSKMSHKSILAVANHSDIINGVELHTIQKEKFWWNNLIGKYFNINECLEKYNGRLFLYKLSN